MRIIITLLATLFVTLGSSAQLALGSRRAVLDSLTGNWLCCVPEEVFGTDFTATFTTAEDWTRVSIDGQPVTPGSSFTFAAVSGDKRYHLEAIAGDAVVSGDICFTFNPIFELNGDFTNTYQVTEAVVSLPGSQGPATMLCKVKRRGGITNRDPRQKRNYHIKFINADTTKMDRKFFGLRNDNSWLLDAGQIDMLRIRNRVATELWMDMCRAPYYADREPKAMTGVRGDFIEVFLNGKYHGIYALTEALDRKQMKLAKYDEDENAADPFHGMLWKVTAVDDYTRMRAYANFHNERSTWAHFEVKYPDPDDVLPTRFNTLANAVKFVANSSRDEFRQHVGEYFDIPVIMDYWIFINAVHAVDNGIKNIYWAVYDQQQDKKLTLAAWDLDCTFGQNWVNYPLHNDAVVGPNRSLGTFNNLLLRLFELSPDSFAVRSVERYHELRKTLLSEKSLKERFRARLDPLYRSGAVARETARWTRVYDISRQPLDFPGEMAYIENWIDLHMPFLDWGRFQPYIRGDVNRNGTVDVADINLMIRKILNTETPAWYEDLNGDDILDVGDLNKIINIILGRE